MSNISLKEYRKKHKRCRYCKYNGYIGGGDCRVFNWCHAKNRKKAEWVIFRFMDFIQGCACSVYEPEDINIKYDVIKGK